MSLFNTDDAYGPGAQEGVTKYVLSIRRAGSIKGREQKENRRRCSAKHARYLPRLSIEGGKLLGNRTLHFVEGCSTLSPPAMYVIC